MLAAGIDVGLENVRAVICSGKEIIARASGRLKNSNRSATVETVWNEALTEAGLSLSEIGKIVATGQGKFDVVFANDCVVEPIADAKAARFLYPPATSVVDLGADQVRVVTLGEGDIILEVVLNQKCAAGLGTFVRFMARRLEMTLDEISDIPSATRGNSVVNDGCTVFAELDALELLNCRVPREEVAGAIADAVAVRINSVMNDKIKPTKDSTVLLGGLGKNKAVIDSLKKRSGVNFIIPENAEYGGALGAALIAAE